MNIPFLFYENLFFLPMIGKPLGPGGRNLPRLVLKEKVKVRTRKRAIETTAGIILLKLEGKFEKLIS